MMPKMPLTIMVCPPIMNFSEVLEEIWPHGLLLGETCAGLVGIAVNVKHGYALR